MLDDVTTEFYLSGSISYLQSKLLSIKFIRFRVNILNGCVVRVRKIAIHKSQCDRRFTLKKMRIRILARCSDTNLQTV